VFDWDGRSFTPVTAWQPADPLWSFLLQRNGPPRDLRGLPEGEWKAEVALGHAFWASLLSNGRGGGDVRFHLASESDSNAAAPTELTPRSFPLSFGVKMQPHWLGLLSRNSWQKLSDLPELHLQAS
jgi:hypothetical protein